MDKKEKKEMLRMKKETFDQWFQIYGKNDEQEFEEQFHKIYTLNFIRSTITHIGQYISCHTHKSPHLNIPKFKNNPE